MSWALDTGGGNLTEREQANIEMEEVYDWAITETNKITERLEREGKYATRLDADNEDYVAVDNEAKRKLNELRKKYGLEPINFKMF